MTKLVDRRRTRLSAFAAMLAILAAGQIADADAQDNRPAAEVEARSGDDLAPRYRGFSDMAGQLADNLARVDGRLPGGPIAGLTGESGFIGVHVAILAESRIALEKGLSVASERLAAHERAVLVFLDRATQISRLLNDLEKAETEANQRDAAALRKEIASLASGRLFAALAVDDPARLVIVAQDQNDDTIYWPHTIQSVAVLIENRGAKQARNVAVRLVPVNSVIAEVSAADTDCLQEPADRVWTCRIDRIEAGEQWPITVAFRHASPELLAGGPVVSVRVNVELSSRKPKLSAMTSQIAYSVANCSANYHAALRRLGAGEADILLDAMKTAPRGDQNLPRRWLSRQVKWSDQETRELFSRAGRIVSRLGAEPWLAAAADGQSVSRVVYGLRRYLRQDYSAALCTGGPTVADTYRRFLADFESRRQAIAGDREMSHLLAARAVQRLAKRLARPDMIDVSGAVDGNPVSLPVLVGNLAELVGVSISQNVGEGAADAQISPSGETDAVFEAIAALAGANISERLNGRDLATAREALALVESAFYFDTADQRYRNLERAFNDVLGGIANAHAAHCGCRTGDLEIAPGIAPVPVSGVEPPPSAASLEDNKPVLPRRKPRRDAAPVIE